MLRKRSKKIFCAALAALLLAGGGYTFCRFQVPDTIYVQPGETPSLADLPWVGIQSAAPSDNVNINLSCTNGAMSKHFLNISYIYILL